MKFKPGEIVVVILHSPREKLLGILDEINAAGVTVRGIELSYFDDWCSSIAAGESYLPMTDYFFPMWRVERISLDESSNEMQSMAQQFEQRTGRNLAEF